MKIELLSEETINKIAAGEVIERPASIVKELTENAIDAGASAVTVEIRDGGTALIRVTDNGCGIPAGEVRTAFLRHATSKIRSADDLKAVRSLGFRGEALSSIAAVCRTEAITKTGDSLTGTRYVIEGGKERTFEEIGAPEGTTLIARDIFFNTPARRKFLKSAATEGAHVSDLAVRLALSHPSVSVLLIVNGKTVFRTSGNGSLKDIIYQIYGRETAAALIPVTAAQDGLQVGGFIGKPEISRGNRDLESYFINGRYIRSSVIAGGIEEGYGRKMMQHQYPFTVLLFSSDPERLDVNVHPSKMEVRFSDPMFVNDFVADAVRNALAATELIRSASLGPEKTGRTPAAAGPDGRSPARRETARPAEPFETKRSAAETGAESLLHDRERGSVRMPKAAGTASAGAGPQGEAAAAPAAETGTGAGYDPASYGAASAADRAAALQAENAEPESGQLRLLNGEARKSHRLVGEVFDTYWIVEFDGSLYIIDQHAAHEKVMYERLLKQFREQTVTSQSLMPPLVITLSDREAALLAEHAEAFAKAGYEIEAFGGHEYSVRAVPDILPSVPKDALLKEMIGGLSEETRAGIPDLILEKTASMACKSAVKGNRSLSAAEADVLIDELVHLDNPYNCPHGRPTIIRLSKEELEKKFRRIV